MSSNFNPVPRIQLETARHFFFTPSMKGRCCLALAHVETKVCYTKRTGKDTKYHCDFVAKNQLENNCATKARSLGSVVVNPTAGNNAICVDQQVS